MDSGLINMIVNNSSSAQNMAVLNRNHKNLF